ncbi:hypothetical protein L7F22_016737 [Adiantum nelumboides]|nr:hypothetical protein [Adiantum nelumboides]
MAVNESRRTLAGYPLFYGEPGEDADLFVAGFKMALRINHIRDPVESLGLFEVTLRKSANTWFTALTPPLNQDFEQVLIAFRTQFGQAQNPQKLWKEILLIRQRTLDDYLTYRQAFNTAWTIWLQSLPNPGDGVEFLKKEQFTAGLIPTLRLKVESGDPVTYHDAKRRAYQKYQGEFPPGLTSLQRKRLIKRASSYLWLDGVLYQKGKDLVCRRVPSCKEIPLILKSLHEEACGGHFAHDLTARKILHVGYVWPTLHLDVQHWCRTCHQCQINGDRRLIHGPRHPVVANGPFERWGIDAIGRLPRTADGKLYILVAIDYMTKWVEAQSVSRVTKRTVSKFVYSHICCRFGAPQEIISDHGPGFREGLLTRVCEEMKVKHQHATPYYPQSNGAVEKANGFITRILRKMVESQEKHWDRFLDGALWAYRITYKCATGFTPFHLVYGQEALQPIELEIPTIRAIKNEGKTEDEILADECMKWVLLDNKRFLSVETFEQQAMRRKALFDDKVKKKEILKGNLVLRYDNKLDTHFDMKFIPRWEGPFVVKKVYPTGYVQLMDIDGTPHKRKVNGFRLKLYLTRDVFLGSNQQEDQSTTTSSDSPGDGT